MGNPYAAIDAEEQDVLAQPVAFEGSQRNPTTDYQNPYASLYYFDPPEAATETRHAETPPELSTRKPPGLTKSRFEQRARAIFLLYVPPIERPRLRAHYRGFIDRNRDRTPQARWHLINRLEKYDLATIPGLNPQFNRERESLTAEKLLEIERSVKDSD